ncbi:MAG: hypothetical protein WDO16_17785 [Bacteroidota bacterium]
MIFISPERFSAECHFLLQQRNCNQNDGFGRGWSFSYHIKYRNDSAGAKTIIWGDGREDLYTLPENGIFKSPRGFFDTLTQYQPGKYSLVHADGIKFIFDNSTHKRITRIEDPNSNFINFTYTDTLLTSVTNAAGQSVSFTYTNGKLTAATDAIATPVRSYTYTYDGGGNLTQVTDPLNNTTKYSYLVNGPMKTMTDKNNNKADIVYFQ